MNTPRHLQILTELTNLPTAPYCEQHIIAWVLAWARHRAIPVKRDRAGNLYLHHRPAKKSKNHPPLVIEAHMDHPGFIITGRKRDGRILAEFRGTVRPSVFQNARAKFWLNNPPAVGSIKPIPANGRWIPADIVSAKQIRGRKFIDVELAPIPESLPKGTLGMWDLPDAAVQNQILSARGCDDIGGVSAIIALFEHLQNQKINAPVIGLLSAEEVAFAGVLAVCENRWLPKSARIIGLETSKAFPAAIQGEGPVIRVGDRTSIFSASLTHFIAQAAGHIADADSTFKYQRKLMEGGTCNTTPFCVWGYDAAALCLPLGNYHNQTAPGETGWGDGAKAGPHIASETIHLADFDGMVRILLETAKRFPAYQPGLPQVKKRLQKLHRLEHKKLLYGTSDQK